MEDANRNPVSGLARCLQGPHLRLYAPLLPAFAYAWGYTGRPAVLILYALVLVLATWWPGLLFRIKNNIDNYLRGPPWLYLATVTFGFSLFSGAIVIAFWRSSYVGGWLAAAMALASASGWARLLSLRAGDSSDATGTVLPLGTGGPYLPSPAMVILLCALVGWTAMAAVAAMLATDFYAPRLCWAFFGGPEVQVRNFTLSPQVPHLCMGLVVASLIIYLRAVIAATMSALLGKIGPPKRLNTLLFGVLVLVQLAWLAATVALLLAGLFTLLFAWPLYGGLFG